ncbi:MAG: thioredoxin-dependent thiol peroxidase [Pikeienuella sp.]
MPNIVSAQIGDVAPTFSLPTGDGQMANVPDLNGRNVVLYFYPRDDTPGCTTEAQDFSAAAEQFAALNTVVIGVSKDSIAKHGKFSTKHGLTVTLASDEESDVCERYGVWQEKNMYGRKFMGIVRATLLIDDQGVIRHTWPKVKVKGHVDAVLAEVASL